jgi:nucleoside-diphosphate-sugar epimerase
VFAEILMEKKKLLVTGSEGMIGRAVVQDLDEHGYQVTPVDKIFTRNLRTKVVDCEDLGQVISMMSGHDAVIHLAAIANPDR